MIRLCFVIIVCWCLPISALAQDKNTAKPDRTWSLHEWGVFTVPRNNDWLKQDMLREWMSFPEFFHGTLPHRDLVYRGPVTKPVIFFHGKESFEIEMLIRFSTGQPLIWWPPVEHPANPSYGVQLPGDWKDADMNSLLRYVLTLNATGKIEKVPDGHWVNDLRKVAATPIVVQDSYSNLVSPDDNRIAEKFVYYDGLMKPPKPPLVERTGKRISIKSDSGHDWLDVIVVDRSHDSDEVRIAASIQSGKVPVKPKLLWKSPT